MQGEEQAKAKAQPRNGIGNQSCDFAGHYNAGLVRRSKYQYSRADLAQST
jgi:hypothetical protein